MMIRGIFHTAWRSLSLRPVAQAALKEKLGPGVQPEIAWYGFVSVWIQSRNLPIDFCILLSLKLRRILYSFQSISVCFTALSRVYSSSMKGIHGMSLLL